MAVRVPTAMSDEHKAALAVGRSESRAVRAYLDALDTNRPKRGRKRTSDTVRRRLDAIETDLVDAAPLTRLQLAQERMDLHDELAAMGEGSNLAELEARFVETAAGYATRKHGPASPAAPDRPWCTTRLSELSCRVRSRRRSRRW